VSIDYYSLGRQTGKMALEVLGEGGNPAMMPIQYLEDVQLVLNMQAAERMGIAISSELVGRADQIFE